jgi:uncharacterized protein YjiS (DUF1127 family)
MLSQNCKPTTAAYTCSKAKPQHLRDDHIILLAIDAVLAAHAAIKRWLERRRTRRALAALDDRQLRDIGVTRTEVKCVNRRWWPGRDKSRRALAELDDSQLSNLSEIGLQVRRDARRASNRA